MVYTGRLGPIPNFHLSRDLGIFGARSWRAYFYFAQSRVAIPLEKGTMLHPQAAMKTFSWTTEVRARIVADICSLAHGGPRILETNDRIVEMERHGISWEMRKLRSKTRSEEKKRDVVQLEELKRRARKMFMQIFGIVTCGVLGSPLLVSEASHAKRRRPCHYQMIKPRSSPRLIVVQSLDLLTDKRGSTIQLHAGDAASRYVAYALRDWFRHCCCPNLVV